MQLDWLTFTFEVINFLVLVWILQRFLYKPVLATIARRKAAIDKTLADAREQGERAEKLDAQYRARLAEWEKEKASLRDAAIAAVEAERTRRLAAIEQEVTQAKERHHAIEVQQADQLRRQLARSALSDAGQFASRLLQRLASPALEERLVTMALEDLAGLPPAKHATLAKAARETTGEVQIASAFPLADEPRGRVTEAVRAVTGTQVRAQFSEDPTLLAGLRVSIGSLVLHANLRDELEFFTKGALHDG